MERRRRGKGGKQGRRKSKEFMDAALEAYIRHLALQKWREVTDLQETVGVDTAQAICEAGSFLERGAYRDIWERCWRSEVAAARAPELSARYARSGTASPYEHLYATSPTRSAH